MTTIASNQTVEIYLDNPTGVRIALLDYLTFYEYALLKNEPGPFRIRLPYNFDRSMIGVDYIIEIVRGIEGTQLFTDFCGFIRKVRYGDVNGLPYTEISGYSTMELLFRRIAKDEGGVVQTLMTGAADDLIKAIAKDQMGSDAAAGRQMTSIGGGFTIEPDTTAGPTITKEFFYKNVLEVAQEIAQASKEAGTNLYFDIVHDFSDPTGMIGFRLETFIGQRGSDRTFDSANPIYVGPEWENLINGQLDEDSGVEVNLAYVLGKGEGLTREIVPAQNTNRMTASPWNLREGTKNGTSANYGDTAALTAEGNAYLQENKPKIIFTGDIQETSEFRYGYNWFHGDRVTIQYAGMERDANLDKVFVSKGQGPETVTAKLEVDE